MMMDTKKKIELARKVLNGECEENFKFETLKRDRGLIEKTESSKTILTEDNRELLID